MDNALITPSGAVPAVKKDRKNDTCDMQAWYYQTKNNTYAFAVLKGAHGIRTDIPADRTYFIISGSGIFTINNQNHEVKKGSIVRISAHATYDFHSVGDLPVEFFVDVGFKLDLDTIPVK